MVRKFVGLRFQNCTLVSTETLNCRTPDVTELNSQRRRRRQTDDSSYSLGFLFDGVENLLANSNDTHMRIDVFDDPVFFRFDGDKKTYVVDSDSSLEIEVSVAREWSVARERGECR